MRLNHPHAQHYPRIEPLRLPYPWRRLAFSIAVAALVIGGAALVVWL